MVDNFILKVVWRRNRVRNSYRGVGLWFVVTGILVKGWFPKSCSKPRRERELSFWNSYEVNGKKQYEREFIFLRKHLGSEIKVSAYYKHICIIKTLKSECSQYNSALLFCQNQDSCGTWNKPSPRHGKISRSRKEQKV